MIFNTVLLCSNNKYVGRALCRLIDEGGDWDRRNRLKVYRGLYCLAIRDFKTAANLFLDTVATFTSYEILDYKTFIAYTVFTSMIALDRPDLRTKVNKMPSDASVSTELPVPPYAVLKLHEACCNVSGYCWCK